MSTERHAFIPALLTYPDTGESYCVHCYRHREDPTHIPDTDIEPHKFQPAYKKPDDWRVCFYCGYQRVNMKHPTERIKQCPVTLRIADMRVSGEVIPLFAAFDARCGVDVEHSPRHTHSLSLLVRSVNPRFETYSSIVWRQTDEERVAAQKALLE